MIDLIQKQILAILFAGATRWNSPAWRRRSAPTRRRSNACCPACAGSSTTRGCPSSCCGWGTGFSLRRGRNSPPSSGRRSSCGATSRLRRRRWRCWRSSPTTSRSPARSSNRCAASKARGWSTRWIDKALVEEAGRLELPGRPIAYRTTANFLRCFGLSSLDELPTVPSGEEEALPVPDDVLEGQVAFGELGLAGDDA